MIYYLHKSSLDIDDGNPAMNPMSGLARPVLCDKRSRRVVSRLLTNKCLCPRIFRGNSVSEDPSLCINSIKEALLEHKAKGIFNSLTHRNEETPPVSL
ncbi:hypothetical protein MAR_013732 [Mya arenaria]|uniref:Uncharacterized protein n=1 Tax=Mya arenaria TaxID=6604 RepID=A0ABY7G4F0_MYAAR|nr:hypothetical protein MAR_013732 [Mya arenaria]